MSTNKSFSSETSERYARALFEVSKESSEIDQIELSLKNFLGDNMKDRTMIFIMVFFFLLVLFNFIYEL